MDRLLEYFLMFCWLQERYKGQNPSFVSQKMIIHITINVLKTSIRNSLTLLGRTKDQTTLEKQYLPTTKTDYQKNVDNYTRIRKGINQTIISLYVINQKFTLRCKRNNPS